MYLISSPLNNRTHHSWYGYVQISIEKQSPHYENLRVSREKYLDLEDDGFRYDMIDGGDVIRPDIKDRFSLEKWEPILEKRNSSCFKQ